MTTTPSQRAREAAEAIVSAANIVTCDGYYEIDLDKVELLVAQFEAETLERAAKVCEARAAIYKIKRDEKADDFENTLNEWEKYQFGSECVEWAADDIRNLIGDPQ